MFVCVLYVVCVVSGLKVHLLPTWHRTYGPVRSNKCPCPAKAVKSTGSKCAWLSAVFYHYSTPFSSTKRKPSERSFMSTVEWLSSAAICELPPELLFFWFTFSLLAVVDSSLDVRLLLNTQRIINHLVWGYSRSLGFEFCGKLACRRCMRGFKERSFTRPSRALYHYLCNNLTRVASSPISSHTDVSDDSWTYKILIPSTQAVVACLRAAGCPVTDPAQAPKFVRSGTDSQPQGPRWSLGCLPQVAQLQSDRVEGDRGGDQQVLRSGDQLFHFAGGSQPHLLFGGALNVTKDVSGATVRKRGPPEAEEEQKHNHSTKTDTSSISTTTPAQSHSGKSSEAPPRGEGAGYDAPYWPPDIDKWE